MNTFIFIALFLAALCFDVSVYGQKKEITFAEFSEAYNRAFENLNKSSYRETFELQDTEGDKEDLVWRSKGVIQSVSPYNKRYFVKFKQFSKGRGKGTFQIYKDEWIWVDGLKYVRNTSSANKNWRVSAGVADLTMIRKVPYSSNVKYYLTRNLTLGGKTTDLYEYVIEIKYEQIFGKTPQIKKESQFLTDSCWVDRKGLLLKHQINVENDPLSLWQTFKRSISTYEYDLKIKIEIPQGIGLKNK